MDLLDCRTRKIPRANLIFQHKDEPICHDYGIGPAPHTRDCEFQKQMKMRKGPAQPRKVRDLELPG